MISFSLVDVKSIHSTVSRSTLSETVLDSLSDLILECEGLLRPVVLKRTGPESYTVVDGHLEYYAAVRAKEKNPRKGEMVNAFVIAPKHEEIILKQTELLNSFADSKTNQGVKVAPAQAPIQSNQEGLQDLPLQTPIQPDLEARFLNIEVRIDTRLNELKAEYSQNLQRIEEMLDQKVEERLKDIESRDTKPAPLLESLNNLELPLLASRLKKAGINNKIIENIAKERNTTPFEPFVTFEDVVDRINGVAAKTMIKMIDGWQR
ncbi:hypothetical protein [Laspinema olomoucense]|uniref:ParB/Sulfiredoxin domain-containing protein n=1 Tax=Laspinema olomoucense D3b TaxID=2953688 RepID=A0ABT2NDZ7_9CYAN|nr:MULTISPECIES: hypothetical protein [unclassified Laspinema]MCT7971409.1 hypothetical protein [Laspinema sp. D3d]MCT7979476.1 hypothetical protein [Laspinema sp. D3b]MCT7987280.1 hypothetical protein [Laspinema sp. D3a]